MLTAHGKAKHDLYSYFFLFLCHIFNIDFRSIYVSANHIAGKNRFGNRQGEKIPNYVFVYMQQPTSTTTTTTTAAPTKETEVNGIKKNSPP